MEIAAQQFIEYLKCHKGSSENTLLSYSRDLEAYCDYVRTHKYATALSVDENGIRSYVMYMHANGKSDSSIRRALVTVRSFYTYLIKCGEMQFNPAKNISIKAKNEATPDILTPKEIDLILSQPDTMTLKGCRDRAILEVLYATGMKATEIISLNLEDVSLVTHTIHCGGEATGTKVREVPLYPEAVKCLKFYIDRARDALILNDALFVNLNGGRLTRQGFWKIVKQYADAAGIEKEISPDTIRRSFATQLLQNGADIKMVQKILGHTNIASTQNYLKLVKNKYSDAYARFHPRAV